ncbi:MAG: chlorite dismutase family protein [Thermaerobacter sp.]|nr:chlorite dismutase family protein [Thermaerobacter sp.]
MSTCYSGHLALKLTARWPSLDENAKVLARAEVVDLFAANADRVTLRGAYVTQGFQGHTDLLLWMHGERFEDIQDVQLALRRTTFGQAVDMPQAFAGYWKPFEFSEHPPAFMEGVPPKTYLCFYPFIRTPEYYLLAPEERRAIIEEHGEIGHEFVPAILTNGVYAFGLGDFEWLLSFETDDLAVLVTAVRALRGSSARLYTKYEWPFIVGRRYELQDALSVYG